MTAVEQERRGEEGRSRAKRQPDMTGIEVLVPGRGGSWPAYFAEARRRWDLLLAGEAVVQTPQPVRTSRDGAEVGVSVPQGLKTLQRHAEGAGWACVVQYACGSVPTVGRGKFNLVHSYALRIGGHAWTDRAAVVVWETKATVGDVGKVTDWTGKSVWVWGPDLPPFGGLSMADVRDYLEECPRWPEPWLHAWIKDTPERAKRRAEERKRAGSE